MNLLSEQPQENPHILIIDDEPTACHTLETLLHPEQYHLKSVNSGAEALAYLNVFQPDVILSDIMMPHMDGFELCHQIKTNKQWRHIPIILVTALDNREDLIHGLNAGADEFLIKPVNGLELQARVRSMLRIKKQYDELKDMLQLREDLATMVIHDMRTPLAAISGFSELLLFRGELTSYQAGTLGKIQQQAQRLQQFMGDLLILAKTEQNRLLVNRTPVNINQLISKVEQDHQMVAESKRLNLTVQLPPEAPPLVSLDVNLFQRVLDNLLSNALKFAPNDSLIQIQVDYLEPADHASQPHLRVRIIDQGPGIPLEDRDRIFNKYEVVAARGKRVHQVGLGLAFCKLVIEAHGGCIRVEDNSPQGSIFTVEL